MAGHPEPVSEPKERLHVLSKSDRNPGVRVVQVHRPPREDSNYLGATVKGLGITLKHFFRNVGGKGRKGHIIETIQYPEEPIQYPERNRGLHRLMKREDDSVRCVACMCCPTVCPAHCITIVPAETDDKGVEKYPAKFEIDELRCVVCGLCVEACPCDAIRMDTGEHAKPTYTRADAIETKESMLARGIASTATQGGEGPNWRDSDD